MPRVIGLAIALLWLLSSPATDVASAQGATYYVDLGGNNTVRNVIDLAATQTGYTVQPGTSASMTVRSSILAAPMS